MQFEVVWALANGMLRCCKMEKMHLKCNQCYFTSTNTGNLKRHLKRHSGENQKKCSQCDFTSYQEGLRYICKSTALKSPTSAINVILHPLGRVH